MKFHYLIVAALAAFFAASTAHADINGFDFPEWEFQQLDSGVPPSLGQGSVQITNSSGQARNIWFNKRQDTREFTASYTYRAEQLNPFVGGGGVHFIIHNDEEGANALGTLGFTDISPSIAITLDVSSSNGLTRFGLFRNGVFGSGLEDISPISAVDSDLSIDISVMDSFITVTINDGVNPPFVRTLPLMPSIEEAFGSANGFVGFGGFTNGAASDALGQTISNFQFDSVGDLILGDTNGDGCVDAFF